MKKLTVLILILALITKNSYSQEVNPKALTNFKKNNITISPFSINNMGLGPAIQYERYLDKNNNFSFVFPIQFSVLVSNDNQANINGGLYTNPTSQFGLSVNPGIRMYFVEPRRFNWFIGTSLMLGSFSSKGSYYAVDNNGNYNIFGKNSVFQFGSLVNFGFKGTISNRFTYQLEYGNGIAYVFKEKLSESTTSSDLSFRNRIHYIPNLQVGFGFIF